MDANDSVEIELFVSEIVADTGRILRFGLGVSKVGELIVFVFFVVPFFLVLSMLGVAVVVVVAVDGDVEDRDGKDSS